METNQWIIDAMNKSYNHQDFNTQYRSLAILGNQSGEPETALLVVEFLSSIQSFFEDIERNLTTTNKDESHCPMCEAKEKTIQTADHLMEQAQKFMKEKNDTINTLREQLREAGYTLKKSREQLRTDTGRC